MSSPGPGPAARAPNPVQTLDQALRWALDLDGVPEMAAFTVSRARGEQARGMDAAGRPAGRAPRAGLHAGR